VLENCVTQAAAQPAKCSLGSPQAISAAPLHRPFAWRNHEPASFALLSLTAGADLNLISTSLGCSTVAVTANTYLHLEQSLQESHAAQLDSLVGGAVTEALAAGSGAQRAHARVVTARNPYAVRPKNVAPAGFEPFSYRKLGKLTQLTSTNRPTLSVQRFRFPRLL
jgi:hypothetical protein